MAGRSSRKRTREERDDAAIMSSNYFRTLAQNTAAGPSTAPAPQLSETAEAAYRFQMGSEDEDGLSDFDGFQFEPQPDTTGAGESGEEAPVAKKKRSRKGKGKKTPEARRKHNERKRERDELNRRTEDVVFIGAGEREAAEATILRHNYTHPDYPGKRVMFHVSATRIEQLAPLALTPRYPANSVAILPRPRFVTLKNDEMHNAIKDIFAGEARKYRGDDWHMFIYCRGPSPEDAWTQLLGQPYVPHEAPDGTAYHPLMKFAEDGPNQLMWRNNPAAGMAILRARLAELPEETILPEGTYPKRPSPDTSAPPGSAANTAADKDNSGSGASPVSATASLQSPAPLHAASLARSPSTAPESLPPAASSSAHEPMEVGSAPAAAAPSRVEYELPPNRRTRPPTPPPKPLPVPTMVGLRWKPEPHPLALPEAVLRRRQTELQQRSVEPASSQCRAPSPFYQPPPHSPTPPSPPSPPPAPAPLPPLTSQDTRPAPGAPAPALPVATAPQQSLAGASVAPRTDVPRLRIAEDIVEPDFWVGDPPVFDKRQQLDVAYDFDAACLWPNRAIVLAKHADYRPPFPLGQERRALVHMDGYLGRAEYSFQPQMYKPRDGFLAFLSVPSKDAPNDWRNFAFRSPGPRDFSPTPGKQHYQSLSAEAYREYAHHVDDIRRAYRNAAGIVARARRVGVWDVGKDDPAYKFFAPLVAPTQELERMQQAFNCLRDGMLSQGLCRLAWVEMQRCMRVLCAFTVCCAELAPSESVRRSLSSLRRLHEFERRGVLFDGMVAPFFYPFFVKNGWATYALIWLDAVLFDEQDSRVLPCDKARGSEQLDQGLNAFLDAEGFKLRPWLRPPPAGTKWHRMEGVMRVILPRPWLEDSRRLDEWQRAEAARQYKAQPGVEVSVNGKTVKSAHPILQALEGESTATLPDWALALRTEPVKLARARALEYIDILNPNQSEKLALLMPPVHSFFAVKDAAAPTVVTVAMMPFLKDRAAQAHGAAQDAPLMGLAGSDWKKVLDGTHWQHRCWHKTIRRDFTIDDFYRFGSPIVGAEFSDRMKTEYLKPPLERDEAVIGRFLCHHPVTKRLVENDPMAKASSAHALNQLGLLCVFCQIAQRALEAAGVRVAHNGRRPFRMPDFGVPAPETESPVVRRIRRLVLGDERAHIENWPQAYSAVGNADLNARGLWVQDLRTFLQVYADGSSAFEPDGSFGDDVKRWNTSKRQHSEDFTKPLDVPFKEEQVALYEQEMLDRFAVSALMANVKPVEFLVAPNPAGRTCADCRAAAAVNAPAAAP